MLAHDHVLSREALGEALCARSGMEVVGEAVTSEETTTLCADLHPDVLLLDDGLPGPPPEITVGRIRSVAEHTAVLVLGGFGSGEGARRLMRAGAGGYLRRVTSLDSLRAAIRAATPDWEWSGAGPKRPVAEPLPPRERELLTLVAQALSNREIAMELDIAEGTVKRHLRNIFGKLNASPRPDAVNKAFAGALISRPGEVADARRVRAQGPRAQATGPGVPSCRTIARGNAGPVAGAALPAGGSASRRAGATLV
ncbi:HTH-type transcriptional regulator MalT [Streptomyces sp. enrichment culture]|uniref:LuxR C-terminal-related transcriptional regulator n=1 Tax=Streptomyces sp. enrichment culture TaxID=1795815 RepID=UPI003F565696